MSGIISIEGNLGSGKSTLLSMLDASIIRQPVEQWQNIGGNLLQKYYDDKKRWAFTFQLHALQSRSQLWKKTLNEYPNTLHFSERSPTADRQIFGQIMVRQGSFDETEYQIYKAISQNIISKIPIKAIIYLKCSPQVCFERVRERNRKGEKQITLEYLHTVHERHQEWIAQEKMTKKVITIDTSVYNIYDTQSKNQIIQIISNFVQNDLR